VQGRFYKRLRDKGGRESLDQGEDAMNFHPEGGEGKRSGKKREL